MPVCANHIGAVIDDFQQNKNITELVCQKCEQKQRARNTNDDVLSSLFLAALLARSLH
jgi:hypothetical protein